MSFIAPCANHGAKLKLIIGQPSVSIFSLDVSAFDENKTHIATTNPIPTFFISNLLFFIP
jgi:hypothetical protein